MYLVVGVNRRRLWQKAALKCLPILSLLALCIWRAQQKDFDSLEEQHHPERGSNIRVLVFALCLSCCGDALLVMRGILGLFGILSFAVAQCVYISLFGLTVGGLVEQSLFGVLSGLLVLGLSLSLLLLFGWSFNELLKSGEHGMRRRFILLVMPMVLVYFALISIMLWSALLQLEQRFTLSSVLGAIGGLLFYVSDVLIAAGAIWQLQVLLHGRILVMCTYYGAQLLITLSVVTQ